MDIVIFGTTIAIGAGVLLLWKGIQMASREEKSAEPLTFDEYRKECEQRREEIRMMNISEPVISFVRAFKSNPSRFRVRKSKGDTEYHKPGDLYVCWDRKARLEFVFGIAPDPRARHNSVTDCITGYGYTIDYLATNRDFYLNTDEKQYIYQELHDQVRRKISRASSIINGPANREQQRVYKIRAEQEEKTRQALTSVYRDGVLPCKECGMIGFHKMGCDTQYWEKKDETI